MRVLVLVLAFLMPLVGSASPSVRVLALFSDKAMLEIDGKRQVLAAGDFVRLGELLNANFDLRLGLYGPDAIGRQTVRLIEIARERRYTRMIGVVLKQNRRMIELRPSGFSTRKARSSNSSRIHCMPIRPARGAKISIVSRAFCACFSGRMDLIVRML